MTNIVTIAQFESFASDMEAKTNIIRSERSAEDNARIRELNRQNLADDKKRQRYYSYAVAVLDNMVSQLSGMSEGGRNATLFKFGAACGNMVAANMIAFSECESALRSAAAQSGLSVHEIDNTVTRAINHGMSTATDTDDLDKKWAEKVAAWKAARQEHPKVVDIQAVYDKAKADLPDSTPQSATNDDIIQLVNMVQESHIQTSAKNWLIFNDGYFMSWWQQADVPLAFLSAMLNLAHSRSSTAWVLIAMHQCMIEGRLSWALFSVADVVAATGMNRALVKKAFIELEQGGYVRFLKTDSIYNILSIIHKDLTSEIVHNLSQHPSDYYTPVLDLKFIRSRLLKSLRRHYTEKYAKRGLVMPSWELASQMGIESQSDYIAWVKRIAAARQVDEDVDYLARLYRQEFEGDGHNWQGWESALNNLFVLPVDWQACESIKDVRGQILKQFIELPRRNVNSQMELSRLIGCSSATLSDVMRSQNIATIEQTQTIEVEADFHNLQPVKQQIQRDTRGMIRMMWFKEKNEKGWLLQDLKKADVMYVRNKSRLEKVSVQVVTPSLQKVMTPEEIEAVYTIREKIAEVKAIDTGELSTDDQYSIKDTLKRAKKAARAAKMNLIPKLMDELDTLLAAHSIPDTSETVAIIREKRTESKPRKQTVNAFDWTQYRDKVLWRDASKQIRMYTDYTLAGDCVLDSENNLIFKANYNLPSLYSWMRDNAQEIKRPLRAKSEDYTAEIRARLRENRQNEIKEWYDSLVPDFDMPTATVAENKVIQMPLENAKPKPQPVTSERQQAFLDFCKTRMEREYGVSKLATLTLPAKPPVSESWVDASGILYEVAGDELYVDNVRQHMTDELWNFVSRKRKSA